MKDKDTAVVYLEFKPDGAYRGFSYYFAQGNGCGYCGGNLGVTSTVKLANGRHRGHAQDEGRGAQRTTSCSTCRSRPTITARRCRPTAARRARRTWAYHDALVKRDAKALRPLLSDELRASLDRRREEGQGRGRAASTIAKEHPDKSVRIVKGFSKGNHAVLLIEGETGIMRLAGEVVLVNEGGTLARRRRADGRRDEMTGPERAGPCRTDLL